MGMLAPSTRSHSSFGTPTALHLGNCLFKKHELTALRRAMTLNTSFTSCWDIKIRPTTSLIIGAPFYHVPLRNTNPAAVHTLFTDPPAVPPQPAPPSLATFTTGDMALGLWTKLFGLSRKRRHGRLLSQVRMNGLAFSIVF